MLVTHHLITPLRDWSTQRHLFCTVSKLPRMDDRFPSNAGEYEAYLVMASLFPLTQIPCHADVGHVLEN